MEVIKDIFLSFLNFRRKKTSTVMEFPQCQFDLFFLVWGGKGGGGWVS